MIFRSFILLSLVSFSLSVIAQPYQSIFGKSSTTWFIYGENIGTKRTVKFEVEKDTSILGISYRKIIWENQGTTFLREDTIQGKLWLYNGKDKEQLVQDFSLKLGDTIYQYRNGLDTLIVDRIFHSTGAKHIEFDKK